MSEIPQELTTYLATMDRIRSGRVTAALEELDPAEQKLVKEAAVMGYMLGTQAPRDARIPADSDILRSVIAACLGLPDLYPLISGYVPDEDEDTE